jgi:hypothetical protein
MKNESVTDFIDMGRPYEFSLGSQKKKKNAISPSKRHLVVHQLDLNLI